MSAFRSDATWLLLLQFASLVCFSYNRGPVQIVETGMHVWHGMYGILNLVIFC